MPGNFDRGGGIVLPAPLLECLQQGLSRFLLLDDKNRQALEALAGKVIKISASEPDLELFILLTADGLLLRQYHDDRADVFISGAVADLLDTIGAGRLTVGDLDISGDIVLAQQFQALLKNTDIDYEEYLSRITGDIIARRTANGWRRLSEFRRGSGAVLGASIGEYLRYEARLLPDRLEIDDFNDAVDRLAGDVGRLQKRIARLMAEEQ